MIAMYVGHEIVAREYPKDLERLINIIRNSDSKSKDTPIEQMSFGYNFSFFVKKGGYTPEYVEGISKLPFDERYEHELSKVRVSLVISAGYFYISDRAEGVSDTIKEAVRITTAQKMKLEAEQFEDDSLLHTIPDFETDEESMPKNMTLEDQLQKAISEEDYLEAARLRDEIRKMIDEE